MVLQHIIHTYVDDDSHLLVSKMYLRKNRLIISIKNTSIKSNQSSRASGAASVSASGAPPGPKRSLISRNVTPLANNARKSLFRAVVVRNVHSSARVEGTLTNCGVVTRVAAGTNGINVCQACMFTAFNVRSSARKAPVASRAYMDTP